MGRYNPGMFPFFFPVMFCISASCNCCCSISSWQEHSEVGPGEIAHGMLTQHHNKTFASMSCFVFSCGVSVFFFEVQVFEL